MADQLPDSLDEPTRVERARRRKRGFYLALASCVIAAWTLVFEVDCVFQRFGLVALLVPLFRG